MDTLKPNMYVRTDNGIGKYIGYNEMEFWDGKGKANYREFLKEPSYNIIDLIEYMDILVIQNKLKDINNREIYLFNPVRCDGFTTFEDGKHCMIINMDYIIPIENIKVYQVLTHEMFESMSYKLGDE